MRTIKEIEADLERAREADDAEAVERFWQESMARLAGGHRAATPGAGQAGE